VRARARLPSVEILTGEDHRDRTRSELRGPITSGGLPQFLTAPTSGVIDRRAPLEFFFAPRSTRAISRVSSTLKIIPDDLAFDLNIRAFQV